MARRKSDPPGEAEKEPGTPAVKDGSPNESEFERRRREREAGESGTSIAERTENGEDDPSSGEELFPLGSLEGDPKVTLKTLIKGGADVTALASMGSAAVPLTGNGFFDPEEEVVLLVRALPGGISPVPTHEKSDGNRHKVKSWKATQKLDPIHVQPAGDMYSRGQVLEFLHEAGVPAATVTRLLGDEAGAVAAS